MFPILTEHGFGVLVLSAEVPVKRHWPPEPYKSGRGQAPARRVGIKTLALIGILARALGTKIAGFVPPTEEEQ